MNLFFGYTPLVAGALLWGAPPCVLKGTIGVKEGLAVLHQDGRQDTAIIHGGQFSFHPGLDDPARPVLASVDIHTGSASAYIAVPVILEPGEVRIAERDGRYIVGGTTDNTRFQQLRDRLAPFRDSIERLKTAAYQASADEQARLLKEVDRVFAGEALQALDVIKDDDSYAGLAQLSLVYRKVPAAGLSGVLQEYKAFAGDPLYRRLEDYFAALPKGEVGLPAPSFTLVSKDGAMVSLDSFRGKYVLLDFWFHNCVFCRQMAPSLVKLYSELKDKNFEIVSVSVDAKEYERDWRAAIDQDKSSWTELWDYDSKMPGVYGVTGYPTMFLLDPQGKIILKILGFQPEDALRSMVIRSMGDGPSASPVGGDE